VLGVAAIIIAVVMVMAMLMVVMMPVVRATVGGSGQLAVEVGGDQLLDRRIRHPRPHGDAVMGEVGQSALTDASSNDDLNALLAQPARENAGLVFGGRQHLCAERDFSIRIHLDQRKLAATAKVSVEAAGYMGDGNFHRCFELSVFVDLP
jgi:hypothetical protein